MPGPGPLKQSYLSRDDQNRNDARGDLHNTRSAKYAGAWPPTYPLCEERRL